jgi:hypothetical protein
MQSSSSASPRSVARANEVTAAQSVSSSITRRSVVAGLAVTTAPITVLAAADSAHAQATQTMPEKEPAAARMAYQEPGKASRPQVHADALGL